MNHDEKRFANDHQIRIYFNNYDRFWRLNKLVCLRETLRNRENLQEIFRQFYGDGYFEYDSLVYQNLTNGILADAVSETVMYCEDYLSILKFIRERYNFVSKTVSYAGGVVSNIASGSRRIGEEKARKMFFLPSHVFSGPLLSGELSEAQVNTGNEFQAGIGRIIEMHQGAVRFYEKYRDAHVQYKHGLKLCINGLGGSLDSEELERRKMEMSASVFIMQNRPLKEAAKSGGLMIPDISQEPIRNNLNRLFKDRNLLHFELLHDVGIDYLLCVARDVAQLLNVIVFNRVALMDAQGKQEITVSLPSRNTERMTSNAFTFVCHPGQSVPTIDDFQIQL